MQSDLSVPCGEGAEGGQHRVGSTGGSLEERSTWRLTDDDEFDIGPPLRRHSIRLRRGSPSLRRGACSRSRDNDLPPERRSSPGDACDASLDRRRARFAAGSRRRVAGSETPHVEAAGNQAVGDASNVSPRAKMSLARRSFTAQAVSLIRGLSGWLSKSETSPRQSRLFSFFCAQPDTFLRRRRRGCRRYVIRESESLFAPRCGTGGLDTCRSS
jgi:hypothetical protein